MNIVTLALAAGAGALIQGLLSWSASNEAFSPRKFMTSIGAALVTGVGTAIMFAGQAIGYQDLLLAFAAGMGVNAGTNKSIGVVAKMLLPTPPLPPGFPGQPK